MVNQDKINEIFIEYLYNKIKEYRAWQYKAELNGFIDQARICDSLANNTIQIHEKFTSLIDKI